VTPEPPQLGSGGPDGSNPARGRTLPGTDKPHPAETSAEIAALAPNIEVQRYWRAPDYLDESIRRVRAFLERKTPR
jgi:hypothetical protein